MDEEWWTYWTYEVSLWITIFSYVPLSRSEHWYFRKVARRPQGTKYFSYPTCQWLFWWKLKQVYTHLLHMPFLPRTPRPLQFPDVGSWCLGKWTSAIEHKCAKSTMFKILDGVELGRPFWSVIPREGPLEWQKIRQTTTFLVFFPTKNIGQPHLFQSTGAVSSLAFVGLIRHWAHLCSGSPLDKNTSIVSTLPEKKKNN